MLYGWHQKDNEKHFSFPFWDFPIHVPTFRLEKNQCPSNFKRKNSYNLDDNQSNLLDISLKSCMFLLVENLISYLISLSLEVERIVKANDREYNEKYQYTVSKTLIAHTCWGRSDLKDSRILAF